MLIAIVSAVLLIAATVGLALGALRDEYLVVLHWPKQALFVLEWTRGGQYRIISPARLPLALGRYLVFLLGMGVVALRRRMLARSGKRIASPAGIKA